ncbi:zinc ribbon domain-containing protein [Agromyces sp. LHK192]|uniref:zinc ribbon domain-containing protein n=1 Tax=Agromyces sp. LHK192 TaxID=2498704 RepID=UPI000FD8333E|nr:C4-type zinc ribbon domain-containing protein [Agromyces sp. LHK192]
MKASAADQQELLRLQAIDTRLAQLAHRLGALPQAAPLAELATKEDSIRRTRAEAVGVLEDAKAELGRLESDVSMVEARIARDGERLTHTSSLKDVSALEAELVSLKRRLSDLEDAELVVMEKVDQAQGAVDAIDDERAAIGVQQSKLEAERDEAAAGLTTERDQAARDREVVAGTVPEALLAFYEQRRARGGGVGAALLRQRTCGGCTITLTGSDLESVRRSAPDEVVQCPECDRILVRTDESGL